MTHPLSPEIVGATVVIGGITSWITDEDFNRLVGPWGGFVVSIVLCAILLRHSAKRIKREDDRAANDATERERRHQENLAKQSEIAVKFEAVTDKVTQTQLETVKALLRLSHSNENLHAEMRSRPCQRITAHTEPPE
jgi:hypothetical protein